MSLNSLKCPSMGDKTAPSIGIYEFSGAQDERLGYYEALSIESLNKECGAHVGLSKGPDTRE